MSEKHEWQFRFAARFGQQWKTLANVLELGRCTNACGCAPSEAIIQRRRRRDHLDPTPCEGIEDPVWRDWIASDDPDIQGVLIAKGMPFRSLEKWRTNISAAY